jgi:hypothetical protein
MTCHWQFCPRQWYSSDKACKIKNFLIRVLNTNVFIKWRPYRISSAIFDSSLYNPFEGHGLGKHKYFKRLLQTNLSLHQAVHHWTKPVPQVYMKYNISHDDEVVGLGNCVKYVLTTVRKAKNIFRPYVKNGLKTLKLLTIVKFNYI